MRNLNWILLGILTLSVNILHSQNIVDRSNSKKPTWIQEAPTGEYYQYYIGLGSSDKSIEAAQNAAIGNVISQISFNQNTTVSVESKFIRGDNREIDFNGNESYSYQEDFIQVINNKGEEFTISGLSKEEEYWQKATINGKEEYQFWILMKIPKEGKSPKSIKQGYGLQGTWRSALIPGWGQLYKSEKTKGVVILSGTSILTISSIISYSQYQSNLRLAQQNSNIYVRTQYINRADNWRKTSFVLWGSIAGLYVYNIIDATTSKGAKKYALNSSLKPTLYAYLDQNQIVNFGITCNF